MIGVKMLDLIHSSWSLNGPKAHDVVGLRTSRRAGRVELRPSGAARRLAGQGVRFSDAIHRRERLRLRRQLGVYEAAIVPKHVPNDLHAQILRCQDRITAKREMLVVDPRSPALRRAIAYEEAKLEDLCERVSVDARERLVVRIAEFAEGHTTRKEWASAWIQRVRQR